MDNDHDDFKCKNCGCKDFFEQFFEQCDILMCARCGTWN
jgi:hypothetical protein